MYFKFSSFGILLVLIFILEFVEIFAFVWMCVYAKKYSFFNVVDCKFILVLSVVYDVVNVDLFRDVLFLNFCFVNK